jgi:hypothetical protein
LTVSVWSGVRPALCGPHSRPHACLRWRSRLRLHERPAPFRPTNHQPTGSTDQSRGIWRPRGICPLSAASGCWRSPALGRGLFPFRQRRFPDIDIPSARACLPRLPDSLQPFPLVSPERGGAFGSPPPANRLSFIQPRDSFAKPRGSPTRDPAPAGATVGRCLPAVGACQVWGLGVQHRRRSLDDCPPFSLAICGWAKASVFFQVPRTPRL